MSATGKPPSPQPSSVYWRRRILLGLGAIAVIVVVILIVFRPAASTEVPPAVAASETPAPVVTPETPVSQAPAEIGACNSDSVVVTAITDADTYEAGVDPQLSFSIVNSGSVACTLNVGNSQQVFAVTSGSDTIWLSTDCQTGAVDQPYTLDPGVPITSTPFAWERVRSTKDTCDDPDRPAATAGGASYHLNVTVGGIESEDSKQFILN